jgi:hypothetical protein
VVLQRLIVKQAALRSVLFVRFDEPNANVLALVGKFVQEAVKRDRDEMLVVPLPDVYPLIPPVVIADDEEARPRTRTCCPTCSPSRGNPGASTCRASM